MQACNRLPDDRHAAASPVAFKWFYQNYSLLTTKYVLGYIARPYQSWIEKVMLPPDASSNGKYIRFYSYTIQNIAATFRGRVSAPPAFDVL